MDVFAIEITDNCAFCAKIYSDRCKNYRSSVFATSCFPRTQNYGGKKKKKKTSMIFESERHYMIHMHQHAQSRPISMPGPNTINPFPSTRHRFPSGFIIITG